MKKTRHQYERSILAGSMNRLVLTLFCGIIVSVAISQWIILTMKPLPQWGEYALNLTLLMSWILPCLYFLEIRPQTFLINKLTTAERSSRIVSERLSNLVAASSVILFSMRVEKDQLHPEWVSDNIYRLLGYSEAEAMRPEWWLNGLHRQDRTRVITATAKLLQGELESSDYRFMHKNGSEVWVHDEQKLLYDEQGAITHIMITWSDITRQKMTELELRIASHSVNSHQHIIVSNSKRATERIRILAFYDPLTKLANRRLLRNRIDLSLKASARSRQYGALMLMDLDRFKILNDTYGHNMGDLLLLAVARRLKSCVRESDTIARMGGDEFVMVLNALDKYAAKAEIQAKKMAEKIRETLAVPYHLSIPLSQSHATLTYHSSASIGVALFLGSGSSADELIKYADLAMYEAKHAGRDAVCIFVPDMQTDIMARASLEEDLHRGLLDKQFLLHYQPQVDNEGRITGSEALVRWQHPQRGMVSPANFIPLAEESGLILPLGLWVLETACAQLATWATRKQTAHLTLAVNVSAHQFRQANFVEQVLAVLEQTRADPYKLKIELTESMLVSNVEEIIAKMTALKAKGVGFSLDDFGTGYSSLTYLKRLPLDQLKIDQGFVRDILIDANDAAIAKMIVVLADSMGLSVIAEGVENDAQRGFLAHQGCHAYQGYLFSHPLPVKEFDEFVKLV